MLSGLVLVLRWSVGLLLLDAGLNKATRLSSFRDGLRADDLVPERFVFPTAAGVASLEILLAGSLLAGVETALIAAITTGLFSVFAVAQTKTFHRGLKIPCSCFGADPSEMVSRITIARSLTLAITSGSLLILSDVDVQLNASTYPLVPIAAGAALIVRSVTILPTVRRSLTARARLAPSPVHSTRVSFKDAAADVPLVPRRKE